MTSDSEQTPAQDTPTSVTPETGTIKDPDEWATGDEPATGAQLSYLSTLARESEREVPENLTKADASKLIDELQGSSPRVAQEPPD
ncbi:DUF3072 domain-containing protein [Cellulomonas sp. JZ18]|uniref:DUF3072 domain-containing protein n=1 Tax=Cellulomonas sp. JZ18 TaxID=2654191 RepID=UPI0012D45496|nr:DUF3072 domain-containing protein [Cellulomonas sp. JZ18]QGQ19030.1 DUF3072 domain-containing protein [Cellulomonas sp. JZ18]